MKNKKNYLVICRSVVMQLLEGKKKSTQIYQRDTSSLAPRREHSHFMTKADKAFFLGINSSLHKVEEGALEEVTSSKEGSISKNLPMQYKSLQSIQRKDKVDQYLIESILKEQNEILASHQALLESYLSLSKKKEDETSGSSHSLESLTEEEDTDKDITINKNILPFFSIPVILKKISDKKENNYLKLLNPQTKLVYKIIKLDTKLLEFITNIKEYSFNLNSFKGNNLDFILFNKNNFYYNLKYRLSNMLYKIEKFIPALKLYSLLNNINLFSPKRLLKPQPYIRFSYRMRYITKINKITKGNKNIFNSYLRLAGVIDKKTIVEEVKKDQVFLNGYPYQLPIQTLEIKGRAINYLLVKLNNLVNEIEYIINIKNKFINLIKWLNFKNKKSILEDSTNDEKNKSQKMKGCFFEGGATEGAGRAATTHSLDIMKINKLTKDEEVKLNQIKNNESSLCLPVECYTATPAQTQQGSGSRRSQTKDLYLQIIKDTGASLTENKIKIEKAIKSIYQWPSQRSERSQGIVNSKDLNRWEEYLKSLQSNVKTNPVDILYFNNNLNRPIINQYLKSMSTYNMITNGTIMYYSKFIGFNLFSLTPSTSAPSKNKNRRGSNGGEMQTNKLIKNIYKFLYSSFKSMYCLISKPVFIFKTNKIVIQLFYFILIPKILKGNKKKIFYFYKKNNKGNILKKKNKANNYSILNHKKKRNNNKYFAKTNFNFKFKYHRKLLNLFYRKRDKKKIQLIKLANFNIINVYPLKFEKLCEVLNKFFKKPVELDLIRLQYPYNDSNILVKLLSFMINKLKIRRITRKLFRKAVLKSIKKINNKDQVKILPAFLTGITLKVAGRLMKYKVIPRKTVKIVRRGSSSVGKINYLDISRYTNKNKRGAFSITIKSGQNFF